MRVKKTYIPFSQRLVQGAIGKRYVVKHYAYGIVKTRFPRMHNIVASHKQKACRLAFREKNALVKAIYNDPVARQKWKRKLGNPPHLYRAIFKAYGKVMIAVKERWQRTGTQLIQSCFSKREKPAVVLTLNIAPVAGYAVHIIACHSKRTDILEYG